MTIQVTYQSLPVSTGPRVVLADGGLLLETDSPMPVATPLTVLCGEHSLLGKVARVREGTAASMLVVPTQTAKLPRWLLGLGAEVCSTVDFEPEPLPVVCAETPAKSDHPSESAAGDNAQETETETKTSEPATENKAGEKGTEAAADALAPSKQTPAEAGSDEEDDESAKGGAKPTKTPARPKKRTRRR